jgi:hypothetical protein
MLVLAIRHPARSQRQPSPAAQRSQDTPLSLLVAGLWAATKSLWPRRPTGPDAPRNTKRTCYTSFTAYSALVADEDTAKRGEFFPIVETFGYHYKSSSAEAGSAWKRDHCRFAGGTCEKYRQYHYGYCSVKYSAEWDRGIPHIYAVCDHRFDGPPVQCAIRDHFGQTAATLVPEVTATLAPKLNLDFVAFVPDQTQEGGMDVIAIETQAIDLRGGGVGPAWQAWEQGDTPKWREYFTAEAIAKGRRDRVDYGVNTGNVYKRLGIQVAIKGQYLFDIHVPLYVVTQQRILEQLRGRVDFETVDDGNDWDITFIGFEYDSTPDATGKISFTHRETVRTTLSAYQAAMMGNSASAMYLRSDFIKKVLKKHRG